MDDFEKVLCKKYVVYCGFGIRSINFMLISVLVLFIWVFVLGSYLNGLISGVKSILDFGIRICVSVLVCFLFWFFKFCIILLWEVYVVYGRLRIKMVDAGK